MGEFDDLNGLVLPQGSPVSSPRGQRQRQQRAGDWIDGQFIAGKIPLDWVSRACRECKSARTLATIWAIWHKRGLEGRDEDLKLTTVALKRLGVDRTAKSRALNELEELGLIRVTRRAAKNPLVTILRQVPP